MPFSKVANSVSASATLQLNAKAARMKRGGEPVIHLGGGEPESQAPQAAITAGIDKLQTGVIRYCPAAGTPGMRDAIIAYTEKYYGRQVEHANVMASAGVKQALMVALMALVDPGDEVVFPVPYWVSYPDMTRLTGGVPKPVQAADGSCEPSLDEMAAAMGLRTRAVILNSPNNPSGLLYSDDFVRGMIQLCQERGVFLLMDDIYHRLVFDGRKPINCYQCTDLSVDDARIVLLNGVSKAFAMTGFRVGWAVGPADLIKVMTNIQSHQSGGPCTHAQSSAVAAVNGDQGTVGDLRKGLETKRDELVSLLSDIPGLKVKRPQGTFYCLCDCSAFDPDSAALSAFLLDKVQVVTVPGVEFGLEGHLRLSYCGSMADVREGVRRIRWALDRNGTSELAVGDRIFKR